MVVVMKRRHVVGLGRQSIFGSSCGSGVCLVVLLKFIRGVDVELFGPFAQDGEFFGPFAQDGYVFKRIIYMLLVVMRLLCRLVVRFNIVCLPAVFVHDNVATVGVAIVVGTLVALVIGAIVAPAVTSSPATPRAMTAPSRWLAASPRTLRRS
jgi:hypothetical protein